MKKLFFLLTAATILASCDSLGIGGTKMDTEKATQKVVDALQKNIDSNGWKIYRIMWMEGEKLDNDLQSLAVDMVNKDNSAVTQGFVLGGPAAGSVGSPSAALGSSARNATFDGVKGITLDMIAAATVQKQYDAAKALIPEGYSFKSVGGYTIEENLPGGRGTVGEITAHFSFNITEDGKEKVTSAGQTSIQYYEVKFNVLPDGSVEIDE